MEIRILYSIRIILLHARLFSIRFVVQLFRYLSFAFFLLSKPCFNNFLTVASAVPLGIVFSRDRNLTMTFLPGHCSPNYPSISNRRST